MKMESETSHGSNLREWTDVTTLCTASMEEAAGQVHPIMKQGRRPPSQT